MRALSFLAVLAAALLGVPAAHAQTTAQPTAVAWYSFESSVAGGVAAEDQARGAGLTVRSANGGTITPIPGQGGTGRAIALPTRCRTGGSCPRAILERPDHSSLDPGTARIRYGAGMLLRAEQTSGGENIVQKGVWNSSSMYKLQVDGVAGHPSCVMRGVGARRTYIAVSSVTVADGRWHWVMCDRQGTTLRILVDGIVTGQRAVPAAMSVTNSAPLRVAGKNLSQSNDQYHGALDNVFVIVGG